MKYLALALAVLIAPLATPGAMAEGSGQTTAEKDPNQIVCKTKGKIGTRFPSKTCRTRAEWDKIAEENRRAGAEMVAGALPRRECDDPKQEC